MLCNRGVRVEPVSCSLLTRIARTELSWPDGLVEADDSLEEEALLSLVRSSFKLQLLELFIAIGRALPLPNDASSLPLGRAASLGANWPWLGWWAPLFKMIDLISLFVPSLTTSNSSCCLVLFSIKTGAL